MSKSNLAPPPRGASDEEVRAYVASLPRDLDGDPYVVDEYIGPWKLSHCCGASAKGVADGPPFIVCRRCYREFDSIDGPARLGEGALKAPATEERPEDIENMYYGSEL